MREMKDINEFRRMSPEDRDWEMYETLHDLACMNGNPCPDRYTNREKIINYASAAVAIIAGVLASIGIGK